MTGIVLQARMGSRRLPGKVMMEIAGRPMLGHIIDRLKAVRNADVLVVATSTEKGDDIIEKFCSDGGLHCFRGDESDVLDRYYRAAKLFRLDAVVRATADNPLVDPEEIERLIELHWSSKADYTHSFGDLPIGVGAECFGITALERSWSCGALLNHREHVNEYIQENPGAFRIVKLDIPEHKKAPRLSLTVDTPAELEKVRAIYAGLYKPGSLIRTEEVIKFCAMQSA